MTFLQLLDNLWRGLGIGLAIFLGCFVVLNGLADLVAFILHLHR